MDRVGPHTKQYWYRHSQRLIHELVQLITEGDYSAQLKIIILPNFKTFYKKTQKYTDFAAY